MLPHTENSLDQVVKASVINTLEPHDTALFAGVPGGSIGWIARELRPDLNWIAALPEPVVRRYPSLATNASKPHDGWAGFPILGAENAEMYLAPPQVLGNRAVFPRAHTAHVKSLAEVTSHLNSLGLIVIGVFEEFEVLLGQCLAANASKRTLTLLKLPASQGRSMIRRVLELPSADAFAIWALHPLVGAVRVTDAISELPESPTALVLAPRAHWQGYGLDRLSQARTEAERLAALALDPLVRVSAGIDGLILSRLAKRTSSRASTLPTRPSKVLLHAGSEVLIPGAQAVKQRDGVMLRSMAADHLELVFVPPASGRFRYGIVVGEIPSPELLDELFDVTERPGTKLGWNSTWWQLRSQKIHHPFNIQQPMSIPLSRRGQNERDGISLLVRGVEIEFV